MKKSLLALAVAAALPAVSQAQTNVTLYGIADAAVEYVRTDVGGNKTNDVNITNGVWSGSRVGLQGSEDLGGGLRGIFNFEHRVSIDTGTQTNAGVTGTNNPASNAVGGNVTGSFWQQSYVGLAGGFGEIRLGRDYTVGFRAILPGDTTGYSWYQNASGSSNATGGTGGLGGFTVRQSNAVQYITPSLGGFKLWTMYGAGEQAGGTKLGDMWQVGGVGNWGPIGLGLFYGSSKATALLDRKELGGSIGGKFGSGTGVGLAYVRTEIDNAANKNKGIYASLSQAFGASTIYLAFKRSEFGDLKETGVGLSYAYALSKRTVPYFSFGYAKLENPGAADSKPINVALGLRHYF